MEEKTILQRKKIGKWVIYVLGVSFVGGIGTGIWEYILKPIFSVSSDFVFNLISFGVDSFKSQIYLEIARNIHEGISLSIFSIIISAFLGLIIVCVITLLFKNNILNKNKDEKKYLLNNKLFLILYLFFSVSLLIGDLTRINYINDSITKYNQLSIIVKPYISEFEYNKIQSSFALIKNKSDYDTILNNLSQIAKDNKINVDNIN